MENQRFKGQCFCGYVVFEMTEEPITACHCHCASCQRASGAALVTWVTFPASSFRLRKGVLAEHRSSPGVVRGHCADCGTSITYSRTGRPDEIDITATSLEAPDAITPAAHIWLEDKQPWLTIDDGLPQYKQWVRS